MFRCLAESGEYMEAMVKRCAGLDVHQETVVACVLIGELDKKPKSEIRTFGTYTKDLEELHEWLLEKKVEQVAMESTGVFWKCVWNIIEDERYEIKLANAKEIKNMPGRKTDIKDAQWIAELLRCGLIKSSFVPNVEIRELRDLTRYKRKIVQQASSEKNRIHKILQDANIKITTDMSDIFGETGRRLLEMIIEGKEIRTEDLVEITSGRGKASLREKIPQIKEGLKGTAREHHRKMLKLIYEHLKYLEKEQEEIEKLIDEKCNEYKKEIELLDSIPGIDQNSAKAIIAEIGTNMNQFPTVKHLTSWAGMSPGNNESGGIKKNGKSTKGNRNLRATLNECAWSCIRSKKNRISSTYWRFIKRMGPQKAIHAIGNLILRLCYHILVSGIEYEEREKEDYEKILQKKKEQRMIKELKEKGYKIEIAS